ncbi:helix-turn-helix domain-containing protein [Micromonospora haikouensis]|uniref:helix-turn-helix domain-containing protein n=1 Tax=Micromonospora haikouensis TaxID=686309 RepID=UPI0009E3F770|nr:helix-turn-helix domain-containing protein [Micromonospora haikouensis]
MTELDTDRFLTVQEVADVLRVSRWSVGRYIGAGALEAIKGDGPNGSIRIPLRSLHAYIEAHTVAGSERGRGDPRRAGGAGPVRGPGAHRARPPS